jgi:hypothetical protein
LQEYIAAPVKKNAWSIHERLRFLLDNEQNRNHVDR